MFTLILTLAAAVAVLSAIDLPSVQRRQYTIVKPRPQWKELGYTDYCKKYVY